MEKLQILMKLQETYLFQGKFDMFIPEDQGLKSKTKVPRLAGEELSLEVVRTLSL